jgi:hypothetical protein
MSYSKRNLTDLKIRIDIIVMLIVGNILRLDSNEFSRTQNKQTKFDVASNKNVLKIRISIIPSHPGKCPKIGL